MSKKIAKYFNKCKNYIKKNIEMFNKFINEKNINTEHIKIGAIIFFMLILVAITVKAVISNFNDNLYKPVKMDNIDMWQVGVTVPNIDFASSNSKFIVFHDYRGLFVYDINKQTIYNTLDLISIDSVYTQGDTYTQILVDNKTNLIYIDNKGDNEDDMMYMFKPSKNKLFQVPTKDLTELIKSNNIVATNEIFEFDNMGSYSNNTVVLSNGDSTQYGLIRVINNDLSELEYVIFDETLTEIKSYKVFDEYNN